MATLTIGLTLGTPAEWGELASTAPISRLRLGPLEFPCPVAPISESLGDGLEAAGAALIMGERRARPFKLELAVRGNPEDADERATGMRLRRQLRQLLENAEIRKRGLYFYWSADAEVAGWLMVGGGEITETDPGISFGDFTVELTDCYLRGRPGTHRPGRRLDLADRRTGLVPLDTRRLLYRATGSGHPLPTEPLILPGDLLNAASSTGAPVTITPGPLTAGHRLYSTAPAVDGEVISYVPDPAVLITGGLAATLELEERGGVRVWDQRGVDLATADPVYAAGDPTLIGWEQVYGPLLDYAAGVAVDNGLCRLVWVAEPSSGGGGLALEQFDATTYSYRRVGRFVGLDPLRLDQAEVAVVEITNDRAVLEWRLGERALRAILCRGWYGPRLEHYTTAALTFVPEGTGTTTVAAQTPAWVAQISRADTPPIRWARGDTADTLTAATLDGQSAARALPATGDVLVAQITTSPGPAAAALASLALADARSEPVLLTRGAR